MSGLPLTGWGVGDIEGIAAIEGGFPRAISFYRGYDLPRRWDPLRGGEYSESAFHTSELEAQAEVRAARDALVSWLDGQGIANHAARGGQDPLTLKGEFSHKLAATRAGLGWIGKSTLLMTAGNGPRVVLNSVLVDARLSAGEPVSEMGCGSCHACVEACPYGYVSGEPWEPGIERDRMLDAHGCSGKRVELGESIGRKHECGLCLLLCPKGARG